MITKNSSDNNCIFANGFMITLNVGIQYADGVMITAADFKDIDSSRVNEIGLALIKELTREVVEYALLFHVLPPVGMQVAITGVTYKLATIKKALFDFNIYFTYNVKEL